jgi:putative membrane protein
VSIYLKILVGFVAIEHLFILWVEMFSWTKMGKKMFRSIEQDLFERTKVLAANQGLYNGFLAAGLIWAIFIENSIWSYNIATFFLGCVVIAGIYGAITSSKSILFKQAMPAALVFMILIATR